MLKRFERLFFDVLDGSRFPSCLRPYFEHGVSADMVVSEGSSHFTLLTRSCKRDNLDLVDLDLVDLLLEFDADPNLADPDGRISLASAVFAGDLLLIEALVNSGAVIDEEIMVMALEEQTDDVSMLLFRYLIADRSIHFFLNVPLENYHETLLHIMLRKNRGKNVLPLLNLLEPTKPEWLQQDRHGNTIMHSAFIEAIPDVEVIQWLMEHAEGRAMVHVENNFGRNVLTLLDRMDIVEQCIALL
jgi:ankyrin repeat protein